MKLQQSDKRHCSIAARSFFVPAALCCLFQGSALFGQEVYSTWPDSIRITINTTSTGANVTSEVYNFPVLVRLNPSTFRGFAKTLPGGADIRFAKSNGAHFSYEIERWIDGPNDMDTAEIWVRIDTVRGDSDAHHFRMYWGKSGVTGQSNPHAVFDTGNGFMGVWHLNTPGTGNRPDATINNNGAGVLRAAFTSRGAVAGCDTFICSDRQYDSVAAGIDLANKSFTVAAWFKLSVASPDSFRCILGQGVGANDSGLHFGFRSTSKRLTFAFFSDDIDQASNYSGGTDWHLLVGTYDAVTRRQTIFYDGASDNSRTAFNHYRGSGAFRIGRSYKAGGLDGEIDYFGGNIDEVRVEKTARSAAWIKLSYETQKPNASCVFLDPQLPAAISVHPRDTTVFVAAPASMRVTATGTAPLNYQWYRGGTLVSGKTGATIAFDTTKFSDSGSYACVVWNSFGRDTSTPAKLTVRGRPAVITVHPRDTTVQVATPARMRVTASGTAPLNYQWYRGGTLVSGKTGITIVFDTAKFSDSGSYTCVVWNPFGRDTSTPAKLTVRGTKPVVSAQPKNVSVFPGQPWSVSVSVSGIPAPSYAWYKTGISAPAGSDSVYSVKSAQKSDAGSYYCIAANSFGACTSRAATVTILADTIEVVNPIAVEGTFKDTASILLTLSGYAALPVQATPGRPWYADTVLVWCQKVSFPSGKPDVSTAAKKLSLSEMKAAPGNSFSTTLTVLPLAAGYYYLKASVRWKNPSHTPPDSIPQFTGDANGAKVYMGDSTRLKNPLTTAFAYTVPDTVKVTVGNLADTLLRWDLISKAILGHSIAGSPAWRADTLTKAQLKQAGKACTVTVRDSAFGGAEKTVRWRLLLAGIYNNASDTVTDSCKTGIPRPVNTLVLRTDSVWSTRIKLLWNPPDTAVDSIRIWYGLDTVPMDGATSPPYNSLMLPGSDTMKIVSGLPCSTRVFFGLQVGRRGAWSVIPNAARASAVTRAEDPTIKPIANKVKLLDTAFDLSTNKLIITWKVDTSDVVLKAGIVWRPDSGALPEPSILPKNGETVLMTDLSKPVTCSLAVAGACPPLEFGKHYFFGIFLQKLEEKWSPPTDSSTFRFRIPKPQAVVVTVFKDSNSVSVFESAVVLTKIESLNFTAKIHFVSPLPSLPGLIPVSDAYRFEPQGSVPEHSSIRFGMRYTSIPAGFTINDIRMYHHDSAAQRWFVDTVPDRDPVTRLISITTRATHLKHLFLLAIDTVRPAIDTSQADTSVVRFETEIPIKAAVTDNIANPEILLLAGRADSNFLYKAVVPLSDSGSCKVPAPYVLGDCGMRILVVANDGRLADTADFSRDMRIPDADIVPPEHEKWKPLSASVALDTAGLHDALDEYAQPGKQWEYDKMTLRLFQWADGDWLEYSPPAQNRFSFTPGRVIWLKTRKTDRIISLGGGRTVSLKRPYSITLKGTDWTDFSLPYRFSICIGDVLSATDSLASKELQFYVWKRNSNGQFFTGEFYLPQNDKYNDKKSVLTDALDNERAAYSVWNPFPHDIELRIPGISVAVSQIPAGRHKQTAGWTIAVRPRTKDNEELSPVFCAYRADCGSGAAYPLPPSWSNTVRVGIYDAGRKGVYGNVIRSELVNGGCAYQLVFENNEATPATITCAIERPAGTDMTIGLLDPQSGTARRVDSLLTVTVGANSREYRWLAAGDQHYIDGLSQILTKGEFALSRIAPNPFRGTLRIDYTIPYGGIESARCELIDQLGRVIWFAKSGRSVRPGQNTFTWNNRRKTLAAGAYIVRLTGFDGGGKKKAERMSRVMYLP